jgi:hypothetical protein
VIVPRKLTVSSCSSFALKVPFGKVGSLFEISRSKNGKGNIKNRFLSEKHWVLISSYSISLAKLRCLYKQSSFMPKTSAISSIYGSN